jgi:RNA polymerase-binding transcription factor DksA
LRERLLRETSDLAKAASEPLESFSMDMADAATDQFDHDLVLSRLSAEHDALYEVNAALKRILDGTYGICEQTGKRIPQTRLKAIPWTRFARDAEESLEKKGVVGGLHLGPVGSVRGEVIGRLEEIESSETEAEGNVANDEALGQVFAPSGKSEPRRVAAQGKRKRTGS